MTTACFVSWRLESDAADEVRDVVRTELSDAAGRGVDCLLPDVGAATVSAFLRRPNSDRPGGDNLLLTWYVEHDGRDAWDDPAAAIRDHSPLRSRLEPHLADGTASVVADTDPDAVELVHAALPGRPTAYADRTDALPAFCSADDPNGDRPDVVPLVLRVRRGLGSLVARAVAGLFARTPAWLEAKLEASSLDIMAEEGMYTETLLLERGPRGYDLWWYMESGGMDDVYDAYYDSDSWVARGSERVLGWVLERPERVLVHPVEASDFELLAHAVDRNRD